MPIQTVTQYKVGEKVFTSKKEATDYENVKVVAPRVAKALAKTKKFKQDEAMTVAKNITALKEAKQSTQPRRVNKKDKAHLGEVFTVALNSAVLSQATKDWLNKYDNEILDNFKFAKVIRGSDAQVMQSIIDYLTENTDMNETLAAKVAKNMALVLKVYDDNRPKRVVSEKAREGLRKWQESQKANVEDEDEEEIDDDDFDDDIEDI